MKTDCNPLLKSWNQFVKLKHTFYRLRRNDRAHMASEVEARRQPYRKARR
jgi:hypothetical protein